MSAMTVRSLNRRGIDRFLQYLDSLRAESAAEPPAELLDDATYTRELSVDLDVAHIAFDGRLHAAEYLFELLEPLSRAEIDRSPGLWSWLSLFYFDQVCPVGLGGSRKPGQSYRHVPDTSYKYRHRHLLLGPYQVYRRHGRSAALLLSGPVHRESSIYHELGSRGDLMVNQGVIDAATALYFDANTGQPKRNAYRPGGPPGTVLRFIRVLQQLDVTYDIHGMTGAEIVDLLPPEFDSWRERNGTRLLS
jgi:hypothetical protein